MKVLMKCFFPPEIIGTFTMLNQGQMETSLTDGYNYNAISSPLLPLICKIKQGEKSSDSTCTSPKYLFGLLIYQSQKLRDSQFNCQPKRKELLLGILPKTPPNKGKAHNKVPRLFVHTLPRAVHRGARASVRTASRVGLTELGQAIVKKQCLQTHV